MLNTLEAYKQKFGVIGKNRFEFIRSYAEEGKSIIDIGCCYGFCFKDYNHRYITSVDLDDYSHIVPNFIRANATELPFDDDCFEIAVLGEILEHQPKTSNVRNIIREACRVSSEKVIITVPNEYLWGDETDKFKPYLEILKEEKFDVTNKARKTAEAAKELYSEDNYDHVHHHQHFSPYDLERLIKSTVEYDYYIFILPKDGDPNSSAKGTTGVVICK